MKGCSEEMIRWRLKVLNDSKEIRSDTGLGIKREGKVGEYISGGIYVKK